VNKKEAKKTLVLGAEAPALPKPAVSKSFFASFFSKKEALACLLSLSAALPASPIAKRLYPC
jgi:hypothetical protein